MSYDASILFPTCPHCDQARESVDLGNITSNVGAMYREALPGPYPGGGCYAGFGDSEPRGGLPGLSGLTCAEATVHLQRAVQRMDCAPEVFRAMEPANGWGNYLGALAYLQNILAGCQEHPEGVLAVGW